MNLLESMLGIDHENQHVTAHQPGPVLLSGRAASEISKRSSACAMDYYCKLAPALR